MDRCEIVIVGAGAVGLAIGRELARHGREVIVLEQHADIGTETSSRNSEVIHAGLYYPTGSLKAQLCVAGRDALYEYCEVRGIPHRRCGKLLVASGPQQEQKLLRIRDQAVRNGVPVEVLSVSEARRMEPEVTCTAALHSPLTGIIDSHAYVQALRGELEAAGGQVVLRTRFLSAAPRGNGLVIEAASGDEPIRLEVTALVNSAGLSACAVAASIDGLPSKDLPAARFAKGSYFSYGGRSPFRRLVYPMPGESGLGIHATLDLAGRARFGPDVEWTDSIDYAVDPGRAAAFSATIREYWPGVEEGRLIPAYAGIRPKIVGEGAPAADFRIDGPASHGVRGLVNLLGIESPGLTASLAIGARVNGMV
ncbi:MAG TPA: NAD(P)/FAD-dependent oxidoreductase [Steroidobacteraceae bacterium]|nr:NAD(P)/FAD-dependent oxidoreductase [Steroidobacteraceae bacterium]